MLVTMRGNWNICTPLVGMKNAAATLENSLAVPPKANCRTDCDPEIPPPATHPRELTTDVHTKTGTRTFRGASFTATEKWKQLRCPSTDE